MSLKDNYDRVLHEVAEACVQAGRNPGEVHVIAVSKTHPVTLVEEAAGLGQKDFGENRVTELIDKKHVARISGLRWHLIGQLQTNKVKLLTADVFLHSLDRISLAEKIQQRFGGQEAPEFVAGTRPSALQTAPLGEKIHTLIQVNCSGEASKSGVAPEEFDALAEAVAKCTAIDVLGLMTMAENTTDEKTIRASFALLRNLSESVQQRKLFTGYQGMLSMGMSGDFRHAIGEGATHVRIGSAIFGNR